MNAILFVIMFVAICILIPTVVYLATELRNCRNNNAVLTKEVRRYQALEWVQP